MRRVDSQPSRVGEAALAAVIKVRDVQLLKASWELVAHLVGEADLEFVDLFVELEEETAFDLVLVALYGETFEALIEEDGLDVDEVVATFLHDPDDELLSRARFALWGPGPSPFLRLAR